MNNLEVFNFDNKEVRTLLINNEPWFVGKDVAEVLGYKNQNDALSKHVDDEDKDTIAIRDSIGRNRDTPIINESNLYKVIFQSRKQQAERFTEWVTGEVLPYQWSNETLPHNRNKSVYL